MSVDSEFSATATEAREASSRRLWYIDGIRGVSACYVVLFHMYQFANARFSGTPPTWWKAFTILGYGDCGVAVFIVVSGYCLMLPVAASDGMLLKGGRRRFAERRLRRLGPGYVAALIGSSVLILVDPALHHHTGTLWDASLPAFSAATIAAHVLLIYNLNPKWAYGIDVPMWTIALEVQIYVVFVFGLLPLWRRTIGRRPNLVVIGVCTIATFGALAVGAGFVQPWMLLLFALGMCAADAAQRPARWLRGRVDVVAIAAFASVALTLTFEPRFLHGYLSTLFLRDVVVGGAAALLLLALQKATRSDGRVTLCIGAGLSVRPIAWLGRISYSLYLVHFPIIGAIAFACVYAHSFDVPTNFFLIATIGGSVSLVVANAFHWLFERRYLSRREASVATA